MAHGKLMGKGSFNHYNRDWFLTDIYRYFHRYQPIWELLPICYIGWYIGTSATTDTDISVLPILAISADTDMPTLDKRQWWIISFCKYQFISFVWRNWWSKPKRVPLDFDFLISRYILFNNLLISLQMMGAIIFCFKKDTLQLVRRETIVDWFYEDVAWRGKEQTVELGPS